MKNMKFSAAVLALAGTAVLASAAKATDTEAFTTGDLILGVYDTTGTITNSYEFDLGNFSKFAATKAPITFNLSSDLASVFTSKGTSLGSLSYAVAGTTNAPTDTIYITNDEATPGTLETPIESTSNGTVNSNIVSEINAFRGSSTPTGLMADSTVLANSLSGSFKARVFDSSGSYGFSNTVPTGPNGVLNSIDGSAKFVSDLDEVFQNPSPGTAALDSQVIGTFEFGSNGVLTFDPYVMTSNVPEPSSYALVLCGGAFLFWVLKRRQAQA